MVDQTLLQAIIQATADALLIIDEAGVVQFANPAAEKLFGRAAADLVGHAFGFPLTDGSTELDIVRPDGTPVVAELRVVLTTWNDGRAHIASLRDITERKRSEKRAQQLIREQVARAAAEEAAQRARFVADAGNVLSESLDYGLTLTKFAQVCVDYFADWCIVDVIEAKGALKRITVAQANPDKAELARRLAEFSPEANPLPFQPVVMRTREPCLVQDWRPILEQEPDERYRMVLSALAPGSAIVAPLCTRDTMLGTVTFIAAESKRVYTDIDVALAVEVGRYASNAVDNSQLYQAAQRGNEAKANFLAIMSHELRTPLNAIIGYSDLLQIGVPEPIPAGAQEHVGRIRASARHLLRIIEEILSFSRMEAGREKLTLDEHSVATIIKDVAALIEPMANERRLEFTVLPPGSDYTIRSDLGKVEQILLNLLSNAVKFTPAGSVTLEVVTVDDWTHFHVRDSGVGIPPQHLQKIFEPFWQVEQGRTRQAEGTGLGLSVARRLAAMLGGNLVVQSTLGHGSTFTLQLPNRGLRGGRKKRDSRPEQ